MFYTVYKITNKINGKYYIGKHQTSDLNDGYMGSGKLIRHAIKKYGIDNFTKEIIAILDSEKEMNAKEAELVVISEDSYNLCDGGHGGFSYINRNSLNNSNRDTAAVTSYARSFIDRTKHKQMASFLMLERHRKGLVKYDTFTGKKHDDATKNKISKILKEKSKGKLNSQFGTMWITNGVENKKIKKTEEIPNDWRKGRSH